MPRPPLVHREPLQVFLPSLLDEPPSLCVPSLAHASSARSSPSHDAHASIPVQRTPRTGAASVSNLDVGPLGHLLVPRDLSK